MHELISSWKRFRPDETPHLLGGDGVVLAEPDLHCRNANWESFVSGPDFGDPNKGNQELHLDLLPMPFVGNLSKASIFLLMLNPGFGPLDYFGEYKVPEYRDAILKNLQQTKSNSFVFLDPRFSWHGGFRYWHSKLQKLIAAFAKKRGIPYGEARNFFQTHIAVLELVPYHSVNFGIPERVLRSLRSAQLAKAFVQEELVPRAKSGECLLIATRAMNRWQLPKHKNITAYTASEARSAHLTPESRGGKAILKFLLAVANTREGEN